MPLGLQHVLVMMSSNVSLVPAAFIAVIMNLVRPAEDEGGHLDVDVIEPDAAR